MPPIGPADPIAAEDRTPKRNAVARVTGTALCTLVALVRAVHYFFAASLVFVALDRSALVLCVLRAVLVLVFGASWLDRGCLDRLRLCR